MNAYLDSTPGWGSFSFIYYSALKTFCFLCSLKRRNNTHELLATKEDNSNIRNAVIWTSAMAHMCHKLPISPDDMERGQLQLPASLLPRRPRRPSLVCAGSDFASVSLDHCGHIFLLYCRIFIGRL